MKLPNSKAAVIDRRKLEYYCLNPQHPRGKHKAKLFQAVIGITRNDVDEFENEIRKRIQVENCQAGEIDRYGKRYILDFLWERRGKKANIRTTWIIKIDEDFPRLTTCYVL